MMGDDADDLDAFFDEVEEKVAEVVNEETAAAAVVEATLPPPTKKQKTTSHDPKSSVTITAATTTTTAEQAQPPTRPRGVVVAAASSYKSAKDESAAAAAAAEITTAPVVPAICPTYIGPPPPPPPPPPHYQQQQQQQQHQQSNHASCAMNSNYSTNKGSYPDTSSLAGTTNSAMDLTAGPTASKQQSSNERNNKPHIRTAGGKTWADSSLEDWPEDDFRIFVGNLGHDVGDVMLFQHFVGKYSSLQRAKIVRDPKKGESKGYGFVSFADALDCARAIREMNQTWLGSRPIRIKRSTWKDREINQVRKKERTTKNHLKKMGLL